LQAEVANGLERQSSLATISVMKAVRAKPGIFRDRHEAGRLLAEKLAAYANRQDCSCWTCRTAACLSRTKWPARSARRWTSLSSAAWRPRPRGTGDGRGRYRRCARAQRSVRERLGTPEQMIDAVAARERQELARRIAHVSRQHLVHQHIGCLYADPHHAR
jgi:hypothetical protein